MTSSKKRVKKVPVIKNGAKGTLLFKVFLPVRIKMRPTKAPKKKPPKRAIRILGNPKKRPKKKESFTSPNPIHFSREIKTMERKKALLRKAAPKVFRIKYEV